MNVTEVRELIRQELPVLIEHDPELQDLVLRLSHQKFADRDRTEDWFSRAIARMDRADDRFQAEMKAMREESKRKDEENERKWEAQKRKDEKIFAELAAIREENERKWEAQKRQDEKIFAELAAMREESERKFQATREESERKFQATREESERKFQAMGEESERKFQAMREESDSKHQAMREDFRALTQKVDRRIMAMGARWGISSERAFRDALAAILEQSFGVQVLNVNERDEEGTVYGYPENVELDVIIKNGLLIVCELKSSISKSDIYLFKRKAEWYEQRHNRQADRLIVISPMIDYRAAPVGQRLKIEMYTDSSEVEV